MSKHSADKYRGQRNKEKYELFKRFHHRAIGDLYKQLFFTLFENRCFKCGAERELEPVYGRAPVLCMDHHLPMALGGHLVPGNLVALCRRCNNDKRDIAPDGFYSPAELERLQSLLDQQHALFDFRFDWDAWNANREQYLLAIGIDAEQVRAVLYDPDHPDFVGLPIEGDGFTLTVALDDADDTLMAGDQDHWRPSDHL